MASGSQDQTIKLWDVETNKSTTALFQHKGTMQSFIQLADDRFPSGFSDKTIQNLGLLLKQKIDEN